MNILASSKYQPYQIIFQQSYDFLQTAKTLEAVLQRVNEFIFLLHNTQDSNIIPLLIIQREARELFNNVMHITLVESSMNTVLELIKRMRIYARLKFKQHYAIPFTIVPEPFPLYRILADYYYNYHDNDNSNSKNNNNNSKTLTYPLTSSSTTPSLTPTTLHSTASITTPITAPTTVLFAMHARQRNERTSIASYLRKHDLARTSTFYAYGEAIRQKLQSTHYHCTLLMAATDSRIALLKALTAFKVQYFSYFLKSNNNLQQQQIEKQRLIQELFKRPKKPLAVPMFRSNIRYPVLSSTELVSLMLPDSIRGVRTTVDGIRPYTTGRML